MKSLWQATLLAAFLAVAGCATTTKHQVALTGDIMVDGPNAIANGPPRDRVLLEYRTAAAAMRQGKFDVAKQNLDDALLTLGGIYGKDADAKKARSYFHAEAKKTFIGEPYERAMAYIYRGIIYWMDGEPDNARACFRSAEFEDSDTEQSQYAGDWVLPDYLDGLITLNGARRLGRSSAHSRCQGVKLPPYNPGQCNLLPRIRPPDQITTGQCGEELRFQTPFAGDLGRAQDRFVAGAIAGGRCGLQATTRGGDGPHPRQQSGVQVRDRHRGQCGADWGAGDRGGEPRPHRPAGGARHRAGRPGEQGDFSGDGAGGGHPVLGQSAALPELREPAAPVQHAATIQFLNAAGQVQPSLTKTVTINITTTDRDKVVFVSDTSVTPQINKAFLSLLAPGAPSCWRLVAAAHDEAMFTQTSKTPAYEGKEPVVLLDPGVQYSVTCSGIQEQTLPDGRLEVVAHLRNRENRRIEVQANCVFKDQNGFTTGDETPFTMVILTENSTEDVKFVSMNNLARKYTIRVRQAR
jgi:hypothetical protein